MKCEFIAHGITNDAISGHIKAKISIKNVPKGSLIGSIFLDIKQRISSVESSYTFVNRIMVMLHEVEKCLPAMEILKKKSNFHFQDSEISELVTEAVYNFQYPAGRLPITLEKVAKARVSVDSLKFRQVLENIINNAYKFSDSGEVVLDIILRSEGADKSVGISITDHGIGIHPDQLPHVFDRFWQAEKSGNLPGTGLGMSIAKETISMMHGKTEIESSPGKGTRVTIWLPQLND